MKKFVKIICAAAIATLCALCFAACDSGDDYSPFVTVRFYVNGEVYHEEADIDRETGYFSVPENPADKDGKQFVGWFASRDDADAFEGILLSGESFGGLSPNQLPLFVEYEPGLTQNGKYPIVRYMHGNGEFHAGYADVFEYEDGGDGTLTVNGPKFNKDWWAYMPEMTIPADHNGKAVTKTGNAFSRVRAETIKFSEGLKEINSMSSSDFTHIEIPASVEKLGVGAFMNCRELKRITVASGSKLRVINNNALDGCVKLSEFDFPETAPVERIGISAFSGTALREFTIPSSVTEIGDYAFVGGSERYDSEGIVKPLKITLESGSALETIGKGAFDVTCVSDEFVMPESLDDIGSVPIVSGGIEITAGDFVLRSGAVEYYNNSVRIKRKEGVVFPQIRMEKGAIGSGISVDFEYASGNVAFKSSFADGWKGELAKVYYNVKERMTKDGFEFVIHSGSDPTATVCGPVDGLKENMTVPASAGGATVVAVGEYAFYDAGIPDGYKTKYTLKSVSLPDSIKTIGEYAFEAPGLTEVNMPESLEEIKDYAFQRSNVKRYPLDKLAMKKIGRNALSRNARAIVVSKDLASFGSHSFSDKVNLYTDAATKPDGWDINFESSYNFEKKMVNGKIRSVDMAVYSLDDANPDSRSATLVYGQYADMVLEVPAVISDGDADYPVKRIEDVAFYVNRNGAVSDTEYNGRLVTLPEGLESVGRQAFCDSRIGGINIPESLTDIGNEAFRGCSFASVEIPASMTAIPDELFLNCNNLETVTFAAGHPGLVSIERSAFKGTKLMEHSGTDGEVRYLGDWCLGFTDRPSSVDRTKEIIVAAPVIREGTVGIASGAFENSLNMAWTGAEPLSFAIKKDEESERTVSFPSSLKYIGDYAFSEQVGMIFHIPATVEKIGLAFYGLGNGVIGSNGANGTIYCESSSKPSGWNENWIYNGKYNNGQNLITVEWGQA